MDPGIYNISHKDYLSIDAVSNSYLGRLNECPAAAKIPVETTEAMEIGTALHALVLEGQEKFDSLVVVDPEMPKRKDIEKEAWIAWKEEFAIGKTILKQEKIDNIKRMSDAIWSHPAAMELLGDGVSEQSLVWRDEETGILLKSRPDWLPARIKGIIPDLKTTSDASKQGFSRSVADFGYDRQAAMYLTGINTVIPFEQRGCHYDTFIFIVVEKTPPYRTEVYVLDQGYLDRGFREFRRLLEEEQTCRRLGKWPHYKDGGVQDLIKPNYIK